MKIIFLEYNVGNNFDIVYFKLKKMCKVAYKNFDLKSISSFKIGGRAKVLVEPQSLEEIIKIIDYLTTKNIKYIVVGNCTNLLFDDAGFCGVVVRISNRFSHVEFRGNSLICDAGASLSYVAKYSAENGFSGLEDAYGIPGSIGGAVTMNAGAYGFKMENVVGSVVALVGGKIKLLKPNELRFSYRNSVFKNSNDMVLRVEFCLKKAKKSDLLKRQSEIVTKRKESQPIGQASAGSVFKNPDGISIAKLIDECGLKGLKIGGAMISEKHANFIVNSGNATAGDVKQLISRVKSTIFDKYGIELEEEILYIT